VQIGVDQSHFVVRTLSLLLVAGGPC
jgi:hypothetical protein